MVNFFRNLVKYFYVFVLATGIAFGVFFNFLIQDYQQSYSAFTSFSVSAPAAPQGGDVDAASRLNQNLEIAARLVPDIPSIIISSRNIDKVNVILETDVPEFKTYSLESIREIVTTQIVPNSRVVTIAVNQPDPEKAALIADAFVQATDKTVFELLGMDFVSIISDARYSVEKAGISKAMLVFISMVGSIILGMSTVLIITAMNETKYD